MLRVSAVKYLLLSLDIGQYNVLQIFTVKRYTVSKISKKLLNDILAEFDGSSRNKGITDRLNLGECK